MFSFSLNSHSLVCIVSYLFNTTTWKGWCALQHLLCFGLFLMLRGSDTLFLTDTINPFIEVNAVVFISDLTVDGKKNYCFPFYLFFTIVYCQKDQNWKFPMMSHHVYEHGHDEVRERKHFLAVTCEIFKFLPVRHGCKLSLKPSFSFGLDVFQGELCVRVDPDVTVSEVRGEVVSIAHRKKK